MTRADVNDPASVERIYPPEAFKRDAGLNSVGNTPVLHGLRIMSEPGPDGRFELVRGNRQTGERDPEGDTAFLAPFTGAGEATAQGQSPYGGPEEHGDAPGRAGREGDEYAAFIARIIETARKIRFKPPIGRDVRLQGFHGG
ncbi:MAG TPA: hypothetical protein VGD16_10355 [Enterovirga sp.]